MYYTYVPFVSFWLKNKSGSISREKMNANFNAFCSTQKTTLTDCLNPKSHCVLHKHSKFPFFQKNTKPNKYAASVSQLTLHKLTT